MLVPEQTSLPGRLNPIYLEGRPLQVETPVARQLGLRDGQIIQATAEMRGESLKLLLNGRLFELPPGLRLRAGDTVWLRAASGAAAWLLRPVDPSSIGMAGTAATAAAAVPAAQQITDSRLLALSLRPPMSPALLELFQPAQAAALLQTAGNPELSALFQRMQLSMRGLSAGALQQAVLASGSWIEALLGRGQAPAATDTKAWLRRMIRSLGDKEGPLMASLRRAVDDIEASQVDALAAQARGELSWSMVLPFADGPPVQLRFSRPARRPGREAPPYSVDIHTRNDVLGELWLKTSVSKGSQIDLIMWALQERAVRLARRHSGALGERLREAGLTMASFRIFHSARPALSEGATSPGTMLDVQA